MHAVIMFKPKYYYCRPQNKLRNNISVIPLVFVNLSRGFLPGDVIELSTMCSKVRPVN